MYKIFLRMHIAFQARAIFSDLAAILPGNSFLKIFQHKKSIQLVVGEGIEEVGWSQINILIFFIQFSNSTLFFNSLASRDIYSRNSYTYFSLGVSHLQRHHTFMKPHFSVQ